MKTMEYQLTLSKEAITKLHRLYDFFCSEYLVMEKDFIESPSEEKREIMIGKKSIILELDRFIQRL